MIEIENLLGVGVVCEKMGHKRGERVILNCTRGGFLKIKIC